VFLVPAVLLLAQVDYEAGRRLQVGHEVLRLVQVTLHALELLHDLQTDIYSKASS
jgi:hypothetical protein